MRRRVRASLSPEMLEAGTVKGLRGGHKTTRMHSSVACRSQFRNCQRQSFSGFYFIACFAGFFNFPPREYSGYL